MGQVRRMGVALAGTAAVAFGMASSAIADIASDKMAAIVIYPKVAVNTGDGEDTIIRLVNTNKQQPILAHCFYLDANSHCDGGSDDGEICTDGGDCGGGGTCEPGWLETDFRVQLTYEQPIQWLASEGLADERACENSGDPCRTSDECSGGERCLGLPLSTGVCSGNPFFTCSSNADCSLFGAGTCTQSNVGTRIPPVPEDPFRGELRCIAIDNNGVPVPRNELAGQGIFVRNPNSAELDIASYNAIGIQGTGASVGAANELVIGGANPEYNGCPNYLIVDHFSEDANNPVPGTDSSVETSLVLVPCSTDYLRQKPGSAVLQFLVFNEFEQRLSTSTDFTCYHDERLCETTAGQCERSIWNVSVLGTVGAQTRIQALPTGGSDRIPSAVLGIAVEEHHDTSSGQYRTGMFNIQQQGGRTAADLITIP